jgi:hypothetical protein
VVVITHASVCTEVPTFEKRMQILDCSRLGCGVLNFGTIQRFQRFIGSCHFHLQAYNEDGDRRFLRILSSLYENHQVPVKILVFRSGLGELSVLWEYEVESLCNRFQIFEDNILVSKRREPIAQ